MTSTPLPPRAAPALLLRRPDDRVLKGVCAAVGRATNTDPVLWRVVLAVLTLFGGSGLVLYVAGWLLIPEEGADASVAERWLRNRQLSQTGVVVLVLAGAAVLAVGFGDRGGFAPVVAAGLLAYVVLRRPTERTVTEAATPVTPAWLAPSAPVTAGWAPGAGPTAPRRRRALGLVTTSAALLTSAVLLGLDASGALHGLTVGRVLAAALGVVGVGLVVGSRVGGRSYGLIALALLLTGGLAVTASARVPVDLSAGQRVWQVTGSQSERLGVGEATVDLRGLDVARGADVTARLGAGHLVVHVPAGLHVEVRTRVAAGEVLLPGEVSQGGSDLQRTRTYGPADVPLTHVDVRLGAGQLEVLRDAS